MKQVENVSIGGYAFKLDTEAARAAESYLNEIEAYYSNPEISGGIEERMAELLRERVHDGGVVSRHIIDEVVEILGRPERIAEDQPDAGGAPEKPVRKLYRDMENARVAGVCSGIGAYFNFDPIILRILFAALTIVGFLGFADNAGGVAAAMPLLYLILWICIPAARTAQQRWALRGVDGTAEGVRRSIENGGSEFGEAVRQVGNSPVWGRIGRVLEVLFGILLLLVAVSGLFAGGLAIPGWQWLGLGTTMSGWLVELTQEFPAAAVITNTLWVNVLAIAVCILPFVGILYASIMMLFRIKSPSWHPGLILFVIWLIALVALVILVLACIFSAATTTV